MNFAGNIFSPRVLTLSKIAGLVKASKALVFTVLFFDVFSCLMLSSFWCMNLVKYHGYTAPSIGYGVNTRELTYTVTTATGTKPSPKK